MNLKRKPVIILHTPSTLYYSLGYLLFECRDRDVKALKQVVEFPLKQG